MEPRLRKTHPDDLALPWTCREGFGLAAHGWNSAREIIQILFDSRLGLAVPALDFQRWLGLAEGASTSGREIMYILFES